MRTPPVVPRFLGMYANYVILTQPQKQKGQFKFPETLERAAEDVEITLRRKDGGKMNAGGLDRFIPQADMWEEGESTAVAQMTERLKSSKKEALPSEAELRQTVKQGFIDLFKQIAPKLGLSGPDPYLLKAIETHPIYTLSFERGPREQKPKLRWLQIILPTPMINWQHIYSGKERLENPVDIIFRPPSWGTGCSAPQRLKLLYPGKTAPAGA